MRQSGSDGALVAWVDATAGVAGDMLLGALVDAGADLTEIQDAVDAVLPETVRLSHHQVQRCGMWAARVVAELTVPDQQHRAWREIRSMLASAALPEAVSRSALAVFKALAEVEGQVHQVPVDDVTFHEVGAWDSIANVVGC